MDIRVIKKLHELIKNERTGPPKELCIKLGISERTVYNYISFMRNELNAPIKFSGQKPVIGMRQIASCVLMGLRTRSYYKSRWCLYLYSKRKPKMFLL